MIALAGAVLTAIPSLIKLFTDDDKTGAAIDLAKQAGKALGMKDGSATPEGVLNHLKDNPEAVIKLKQLELDAVKEANRHEEHYVDLEVEDKQNARGANHLHDMQGDIGKTIFIQTSILIPILIALDVALAVWASDFGITTEMHGAVATLIGIALNNAYRERQSLIEFLFGSSVGSKMKEKLKDKEV